MAGTKVAYSAEGIAFVGTLFEPAGSGAAPGVLVAHESPGVTEHTLEAARRLAAIGFVALATDYQGGGQVVTDRDEMMRRFAWFMEDPSHIRARMGAALDALKAQPRVDAGRLAAVGFCYGGAAALELARGGADLKAAVGFPLDPHHRAAGRRGADPLPGAGPHRRRRSGRSGRAADRLPGRDDQGRRRLAVDSLRAHRPQLHQS